MKFTSFLILLTLTLAAYYFGEFGTLYGALPEGGSILNAWIKALLLSAAMLLIVNKLRDFIKISSGVKFVAIAVAGIMGYFYEAGKDQREGRRVLARHLSDDAADGAHIYLNESGKWLDSSTTIEFSRSKLDPKKMLPTLRKIPACNITFPGSEQFLSRIPDEKLFVGNFYWAAKQEKSGVRYTVLAALPDDDYWYFESAPVADEKVPAPEVVEHARTMSDDGGYVDRECAASPYKFHKKAYGANKVIRSEWDEANDSARLNQKFYDRNGKLLDGQVEAEFVYFVEKEEEFQKGFGKAGMMRCEGYYTYRQGKRQGPFVFYYPGHIAKAFVGEYDDGAQVGPMKQYNPNGTLKKLWNNEKTTARVAGSASSAGVVTPSNATSGTKLNSTAADSTQSR